MSDSDLKLVVRAQKAPSYTAFQYAEMIASVEKGAEAALFRQLIQKSAAYGFHTGSS
jgi:hypothetical protein